MIEDQGDREKALRAFDENTLVIAGAGTGKTSLLTGRVLTALLGQKLAPDQILVTTFTEAAAEEMAQRIEGALRQCSQGEVTPGSDAERALDALGLRPGEIQALARQLLETGLPPMQTIHAFCLSVLQEFSREADLPPDLEVLDEVTRDELFGEFFEGFLATEFGKGSPLLSEEQWDLCLERLPMEQIRELVEQWVYHPRWASLPLDKDLGPLRERAQDLHESLGRQIDRIRRESPPRRNSNFEPVTVALHEALGRFVELGLRCKQTSQWQAITHLFEKQKLSPGVPTKDPEKEMVDDLVKTCCHLLRSVARIPDRKVLEALETLLESLGRRFRDLCATEGKITYDDMIERTRQLLCKDEKVCDRLKGRFRLILVDEFQDTDPSQNEIFLRLGGAPGALFVVGDPKQSIYRFRGADMEAYEEASGQILGKGRECTLSSNFRSLPGILTFINSICSNRIRQRPGFQPAYEELRSGRALEDEEPYPIRLLRTNCPQGEKASSRRVKEARLLGALLLERRKRIGSDEAWKGVGVLVRKAETGETISRELRRMGVPVLKEGGKKFYERFEVQRYLALLGLMVHPHDEAALVAILRSPLGGLSDKDLLAYAKLVRGEKAPPFRDLLFLKPEMLNRLPTALGEAISLLQGLRDKILSLPSDLALRRLLLDSGLQVAEAAGYDGSQRLANLHLLIDDCATRVRKEGGDLHGAYEKLCRQARRAMDFNEASLFDPEVKAVRVMTVHKAKGLEFDLTILADLAAPKTNKPSTGVMGYRVASGHWVSTFHVGRCNSPQYFLMEERRKQHEEAEARRLEYVAMTRARKELWLSWNYAPKTRQSYPLPQMLVDQGVEDRIEDHEAAEETMGEEGAHTRKLPFDLVEKWVEQRERVQGRAEASMRRGFLLPSSQERNNDLDEEEEVPAPSSPFGFAKELGTLCHLVLQLRPRGSLGERMEVAREWLQRTPLEGGKKEILEECERIFLAFEGSPLQERLEKAKILGQELPILHRDSEGKPWRGTLDLLLGEEGELVVVDFKTNRLQAGDILPLASRYRAQIQIYQEAIREAFGLLELPAGEIWALRDSLSYRYPKA